MSGLHLTERDKQRLEEKEKPLIIQGIEVTAKDLKQKMMDAWEDFNDATGFSGRLAVYSPRIPPTNRLRIHQRYRRTRLRGVCR